MAKKEEMKYVLQVTGKVRVFVNSKEYENDKKKKFTITDYLFSVSEKDENGKYFNKYMKLIFRRDAEKPENSQQIIIKEGYLLITGTGNYRQIGLFVKEWEPADE